MPLHCQHVISTALRFTEVTREGTKFQVVLDRFIVIAVDFDDLRVCFLSRFTMFREVFKDLVDQLLVALQIWGSPPLRDRREVAQR